MAFRNTSASSRSRERRFGSLSSASTSSLSSIGTPSRDVILFPSILEHQQEQQGQASSIGPQLFRQNALATTTSTLEGGGTLSGEPTTGILSDPERFSLEISVSGDDGEEEEDDDEVGGESAEGNTWGQDRLRVSRSTRGGPDPSSEFDRLQLWEREELGFVDPLPEGDFSEDDTEPDLHLLRKGGETKQDNDGLEEEEDGEKVQKKEKVEEDARTATPTPQSPTQPPVKRGRGRPRKHPLPDGEVPQPRPKGRKGLKRSKAKNDSPISIKLTFRSGGVPASLSPQLPLPPSAITETTELTDERLNSEDHTLVNNEWVEQRSRDETEERQELGTQTILQPIEQVSEGDFEGGEEEARNRQEGEGYEGEGHSLLSIPQKRGPGRPRGSPNKRKKKKKRSLISPSASRRQPSSSKSKSKPRISREMLIPPFSPSPIGRSMASRVNKRGPGRPRSSLSVAHSSDEYEGGDVEGEALRVTFGGGGEPTRIVNGSTSAAQSVNGAEGTAAAAVNGESANGARRRSARERRSTAVGLKNVLEVNAPVMGQGTLKKNRKGRNAIRMMSGGGLGSGGDEEEEEEAGGGYTGRWKGYVRKAEADRMRRGRITENLDPPFQPSETIPSFPPEYGFRLSYFRSRSPSSLTIFQSQPEPSSSAQTASLPTPSTSHTEDEGSEHEPPRKRARVWTGETDEGYEPIRALYTFSPTEEVFRDFKGFIKTISIVGKRQGCVRVTVPKGSIPKPVYINVDRPSSTYTMNFLKDPPGPTSRARSTSRTRGGSRPGSRERSRSDRRASSMEPSSVQPVDGSPYLLNFFQHMSLNPRCTTYNPVYDVQTLRSDSLPASEFLSRRSWREEIAATAPADLLRTEVTTEQILIERGLASYNEENELDKIRYSTDNEATPDLRSIFSLSNLEMPRLSGNSLFKSDRQVAGIHTPYFYFASPGSVFAMHMEDYAALSINFHHWGAPKRWIIICPADSEKLENLITGMLGLRHTGCDQFIRHASIFVPSWVLERAGIRFTEVEQRPGEMVVTFPWAYHEGWNQGLNVAEAIGYGDVDWERWVRGYRVCGKRCPVKPIEMRFPDYGFGEEREGWQRESGVDDDVGDRGEDDGDADDDDDGDDDDDHEEERDKQDEDEDEVQEYQEDRVGHAQGGGMVDNLHVDTIPIMPPPDASGNHDSITYLYPLSSTGEVIHKLNVSTPPTGRIDDAASTQPPPPNPQEYSHTHEGGNEETRPAYPVSCQSSSRDDKNCDMQGKVELDRTGPGTAGIFAVVE